MKKRSGIILALLSLFILTGCKKTICTDVENLRPYFEYAYFEGQKDAISGDVRVKMNKDSSWVWTKSCWDNGKKTTFIPSKEE